MSNEMTASSDDQASDFEGLALESVLWSYWYDSVNETGSKMGREFGPEFSIHEMDWDEEREKHLGTAKNHQLEKLWFVEDPTYGFE